VRHYVQREFWPEMSDFPPETKARERHVEGETTRPETASRAHSGGLETSAKAKQALKLRGAEPGTINAAASRDDIRGETSRMPAQRPSFAKMSPTISRDNTNGCDARREVPLAHFEAKLCLSSVKSARMTDRVVGNPDHDGEMDTSDWEREVDEVLEFKTETSFLEESSSMRRVDVFYEIFFIANTDTVVNADADHDTDEQDEEKRYCLCQRVSYGEMLGCDNEECPYEWFHLNCVGLRRAPSDKWYCPICS
jgi:hypothetical protein